MNEHADKKSLLLEKLATHLLREGLGEASLRRLAKAAGTSDRMLLYYFKDKETLLVATLGKIAGDMMMRLEQEFPATAGAALEPGEFLRRFVKLARSPALRDYMSLTLEIGAASGRGVSPYAAVARPIVDAFLVWIAARLPDESKDQAPLMLAIIDGACLLEAYGAEASATAAVDAYVRP